MRPEIKAALEVRLDAMRPALATEWDNVDFEPTSSPYQRVHHMPARPENPEQRSTKRYIGFMQVTLMYPQGSGSGDADARAKALEDWFPRGSSYTSGGVVTTISDTPQVLPGFTDGDRWAVPVRVPYFANV